MKTKNLTLTEVQAVLDESKISDALCAVYSTDLEGKAFPASQLQPIKLVSKKTYGVTQSTLRTLIKSFDILEIGVSIAAPQMYLGKGEIPKTTFYLWRQ